MIANEMPSRINFLCKPPGVNPEAGFAFATETDFQHLGIMKAGPCAKPLDELVGTWDRRCNEIWHRVLRPNDIEFSGERSEMG